MTTALDVDDALLDEIASQLDLREPNQMALRTLARLFSDHYDVRGRENTFEGVLDVATGVGKTYVLAASVDYLAQARGIRNIAVVTPGRTILTKTEANFTPGHPKSIVDGMTTKPVVITSENFNTAAMRAVMDDSDALKLYVFTVQALLKPSSKSARKTRSFQEGLGEAFYDRLTDAEDLVVFADEHHCYYGDKFSDAVRELTPLAIVGLTATPHKKTPQEQIIYRYPLGGAIADRLVKTPVIVGRKDDRADVETKLQDAVTLLELKQKAVQEYCSKTGRTPINPVALVIAKDIADAERVGEVLRAETFFEGRYKDAVLVVHSDSPDEALEQLEKVEDPESPVRVIVSVGMLKEGWDVKNVYVIVSLRSLLSEILTEQTLGRGLRLPFGAYTDHELLDTLEVIAHERYDQLLKKINVINEAFVDYRTHAVLRRNSAGDLVARVETVQGHEPDVVVDSGGGGTAAGEVPVITSTDTRVAQGTSETLAMKQEIRPRPNFPDIKLPRLEATNVTNAFSLSNITDYDPFTKLGKRISADPDETLRRTLISATTVIGKDGIPVTHVVTSDAADDVQTQGALLPRAEARERLVTGVMSADIVPARSNEFAATDAIVDAFLEGLADDTERLLGAFFDRALAQLIRLLKAEQKKYATRPQFTPSVVFTDFRPTRVARGTTSDDAHGGFQKNVGYGGWKKSMFEQEWFDSRPERDVARLLENAKEVAQWVRLQTDDLPIKWEGGTYNPDFLAIENDGSRWIIEVKSDLNVASEEVQAKRQAAQRWVNFVNHSKKDSPPWHYVLAGETEIATAKGSWTALKKLGQ